jgi:hypothetical protein
MNLRVAHQASALSCSPMRWLVPSLILGQGRVEVGAGTRWRRPPADHRRLWPLFVAAFTERIEDLRPASGSGLPRIDPQRKQPYSRARVATELTRSPGVVYSTRPRPSQVEQSAPALRAGESVVAQTPAERSLRLHHGRLMIPQLSHDWTTSSPRDRAGGAKRGGRSMALRNSSWARTGTVADVPKRYQPHK